MGVLKSLRRGLARRLLPYRERFRHPPRNAAERRAAWIDFLFVDFGILRLFWKNRAGVGAHALRMNQPWPADIRRAARFGIRTIVTARHDPRHGGNALVAAEAERLGLAYRTIPLFSREAPTRGALLDAADAFRRIERPVLLHCKSGADRAGLLAALWLIVMEDASVRAARKQLSPRFLHIRQSRTGILDAVFDTYLAAHPDEAKPFLDWVRDEYDAQGLQRAFRARSLADLLDRVILRRE